MVELSFLTVTYSVQAEVSPDIDMTKRLPDINHNKSFLFSSYMIFSKYVMKFPGFPFSNTSFFHHFNA